MHRLALLAVLGLSSTAAAFPRYMSHQGRIMDASSVPLDGNHVLEVAFFDAPSSGNELWSETKTVPFNDGHYAVILGDLTAIELDDLTPDEVWVELTIDGGAPLPTRQQLLPVPYAVLADSAASADHATTAETAETATNLSGGVVDATEIQINGTTIIDNTGAMTSPTTWSTLGGIPSGFADDTDDDTTYTAGTGLALTDTTFSVVDADLAPEWSNISGRPAGLDDGDDVLTAVDVEGMIAAQDAYVSNTGDAIAGQLSVDELTVGNRLSQWTGYVQARGASAADDLWLIAEIEPADYNHADLIIDLCNASRWNNPGCQTTFVGFGRYSGGSSGTPGDDFDVEVMSSTATHATVPIRVGYGPGTVGTRSLLVWAEIGASAGIHYHNAHIQVRALGPLDAFTPGDFSRTQIADVVLEN